MFVEKVKGIIPEALNYDKNISKYKTIKNYDKIIQECLSKLIEPEQLTKTNKPQSIPAISNKKPNLKNWLPNVTVTLNPIALNFSKRTLGNEFISFLIESKLFQNYNLKKLDLTYNNLSEEGIKLLFSHNYFPNLIELNLDFNLISNDSLLFLSELNYDMNLEVLNLSRINIDYEGVSLLCKVNAFYSIRQLDMYQNNLCSRTFKNFVQNSRFKNLKVLNLYRNNIANDGIKFLSIYGKETLSSLESLNLGHNFIKKEGMLFFEKCTFLSNLLHLNLSNNKLSDEGISHLPKCTFYKILNPLIV